MRVHVLSLGCARTLVDSECLAGILGQAGHTITDQLETAECVVVNTCSFIRPAEEESIATVLELADWKKSGRLKRLYVAGCLPQKRRKEKEDLLTLLPEVDGFLGTGDLPQLPRLIAEQEAKGRFFVASPVSTLLFDSHIPRRRLTARHFAYLKISEGCDHACSFCSIPQFRGPHRSREMEDLVREAEGLASQGVVELNLIGQDTSTYGTDRYGRARLPELLERLCGVPGIRWIRLLYAHPANVSEELIRALRDCPNVVKYIDVPLQHINDELLSAMRRETDGLTIRRLIDRLREAVPGIAIRSTFIVGFPGETEKQFQELASFLQETRLERVGIFPFSSEPKTSAERLPNPVLEKVKQERFQHLMEIQKRVAEELNQRWMNRSLEILVDEPDSDPQVWLGRSYADAPEVDGQVFLRSPQPLRPGTFVQARVVDAYEYDLVAEPVAEVVESRG